VDRRFWRREVNGSDSGSSAVYEGVSKSFRTSCLERGLQMVQLCHKVQLYRYFVSQSSEFCCYNPLCFFSTSVCCCCCSFRYQLSQETFRYTLVSAMFVTLLPQWQSACGILKNETRHFSNFDQLGFPVLQFWSSFKPFCQNFYMWVLYM